MSRAKFSLYEIVELLPRSIFFDKLGGNEGVILEVFDSEVGDGYYYSVYTPLASSDAEVYIIEEKDISSTGKLMKREDFYKGESIRVSRDGDLLPPGEPARG